MKKFKFYEQNRQRKYFSQTIKRAAACCFAAICFLFCLVSGTNGKNADVFSPGEAHALEFDYSTGYVRSGKYINTVILLSFSGEESSFPENFGETIKLMYNDSPVSVRNFFKAQSRSLLDVETVIAGNENGAKVYSSQKSASAYMPRYGKWISSASSYEEINENGYDNRYYDENGNPVSPSAEGAKLSGERILREQKLIREAVKLAADDLKQSVNALGGKAHSLSIITDANGTKSQWGEILWSHKSVLLDYQTLFGDGTQYYSDYYFSEENKREYAKLTDAKIGDGKISAYNVIASGELTSRKIGNYVAGLSDETANLYDVGLLSHELMHGFGFADYYSYINKKHETVGEFDVLASPSPLPQYSLSYVRQKAGWLNYDDFVYINKSGTYTLYPVENENGKTSACKIILSDYSSSGEYFMAEVRSNEKTIAAPATGDAFKSPAQKEQKTQNEQNANLFDSGLSGSGLIVYRVNELDAFKNEKGETGSRDFCNMYGDEVYVFRKGGGESLNSPLGTFSFALLGVNAGNTGGSAAPNDENDYSRLGVKKSQESSAKNSICYSNGENSGIVFENIKKNSDGSVTFDVTLPENDNTFPVLSEGTVKFIDYPDGTKRLCWNMSAKSGYAYVLALRSTDRIARKAEAGKLTLSADEIKNGYYSGYKTLFSKKIPLAEKKVTLPDFSDEALIFIAAETDGGMFSSRYAGKIEQTDLSVSQYFVKICDPFYIAAAGVSIAVIAVIAIVLFIKSRPQKVFDKKNIK